MGHESQTIRGGGEAREAREQQFWATQVPSLADCLTEYRAGPDELTRALLDAVEPIVGMNVLDFACGTGITSAWLAARGATVTGIDVSPEATTRADELFRAIGVTGTFVASAIESHAALGTFDRIIGRFALHHVDCGLVAPVLAAHLRSGGVAAFLETMDHNPVLRMARRHLTGRFGIPRYGTDDEHPLTRDDLELLRAAFGELEIRVPHMTFFRIFDRQVLRHRSRAASRFLGALDDGLRRVGLASWSYHKVLVVRRPNHV